jgi:glutaredoxin
VDSVPCLKAWAQSLGGITYPLLSDFFPHGEIAQSFGVLRPEGYSERAVFILDKRGVLRFKEIYPIDELPDNEKVFDALAEIEPELAAHIAEQDRRLAAEMASEEHQPAGVELYCTPWCTDCKDAREFLKAHGVEFTEIDISRDRRAARRVRLWADGHEITPTFNINGTVIVDYQKERLAEVLDI